MKFVAWSHSNFIEFSVFYSHIVGFFRIYMRLDGCVVYNILFANRVDPFLFSVETECPDMSANDFRERGRIGRAINELFLNNTFIYCNNNLIKIRIDIRILQFDMKNY